MAGKLSVKAQKQLEALEEARRKLERVYSLIEQFAAARQGHDTLSQSIARAARDAGRVFLTNGWGVMADGANNIALHARRGGTPHSKARNLREALAVLRGEMERAGKKVLDEERDSQG